MHYLITGGEGYLASHFIKLLLQQRRNYITTVDSGFSSKSVDLGNYDNTTQRIRRFRSSTTNIDVIARAMQDVNIIYHMADRQDWNEAYRHPMRLVDSNVRGLTNVLSMAVRAGVSKVVYVSSTEVYGNLVEAREDDSLVPVTMYGATKVAAEAVCRGFYQIGMDMTILRISNVWGRGSCSVVDNFAASDEAVIYGDGDQSRDFVHVDDAVNALAQSAAWDSSIYNIASGEETTINGVWGLLHKGRKPQYMPPRPNRDNLLRFCADMDHTCKSTDWRPTVMLSDLVSAEILNLCKGEN